EVEYKDDKGETRKWSFEGTRDEIRKQLESDKEIPDNIRQQLQRSLNLPGGSGGRQGSFGFMMPRGGGMFFGGDSDKDGSPDLFLPGGMSIDKWLDQFSKDLDPQVREQLKGSLKNVEPLRKRPVERERAF
ncbi:MAG: hypothetical protein HY000_14315, partial [Planctomycetes bacterium]|nr:hypothetical protein [Planctomycetota bacterium]